LLVHLQAGASGLAGAVVGALGQGLHQHVAQQAELAVGAMDAGRAQRIGPGAQVWRR